MMDTYFLRPEISNSDLSEVYRHFYGGYDFWSMEGLRFGTLFDAIVTERNKIDFLNQRIETEQYTKDEFDLAERMKKALLEDVRIKTIVGLSKFQVVKTDKLLIDGIELPRRCKYDGWIQSAVFGWDLKSTSAKSEKEFYNHINTFSYYRQRAWYMDISGAQKDLLIAVSKHNLKVFIVPITKESEIYQKGKAEYLDLCHKLIELSKAA
jgi:hypothetical protein